MHISQKNPRFVHSMRNNALQKVEAEKDLRAIVVAQTINVHSNVGYVCFQ